MQNQALIQKHIKTELQLLEGRKQLFEQALRDVEHFLNPLEYEIRPHIEWFELQVDDVNTTFDKKKMKQVLIHYVSSDVTRDGLGPHLRRLLEWGTWEALNFYDSKDKIWKIYETLA